MTAKTCANLKCQKSFEEDDVFITCPQCRLPLPTVIQSGGCQHWANVKPQNRDEQIVDLRKYATETQLRKRVRDDV